MKKLDLIERLETLVSELAASYEPSNLETFRSMLERAAIPFETGAALRGPVIIVDSTTFYFDDSGALFMSSDTVKTVSVTDSQKTPPSKVEPSPETKRTHHPGWRGCGALLRLRDWPPGGSCGDRGMICAVCAACE